MVDILMYPASPSWDDPTAMPFLFSKIKERKNSIHICRFTVYVKHIRNQMC